MRRPGVRYASLQSTGRISGTAWSDRFRPSQTIAVDDQGKPFHVTGLYATTDADGVPQMTFSAYRKVYVTAVGGSRGPDLWNEENPKTFGPEGWPGRAT
jgi:hypothetical protein